MGKNKIAILGGMHIKGRAIYLDNFKGIAAFFVMEHHSFSMAIFGYLFF